jgi:hypothetical protein
MFMLTAPVSAAVLVGLPCRRVLDAALYEWEERMSADNITVLVVEFDWGEEGSLSVNSMDAQALASSSSNR